MYRLILISILLLVTNVKNSIAEEIAVLLPNQGNSLGQTQIKSIYVIDTVTGGNRFVANIPNGFVATNIKYNPVENTISYLTDADSGPNTVVVVNADTGQQISVSGSPSPFANSASPLDSITDFAPLYSVNSIANTALDNRVSAIDNRLTSLETKVGKLSKRIDQVGALSAALDLEMPAPGKNFRLGISTGIFGNQVAIGTGLTTRIKDFDIGAGVAFSGDLLMAKASAGVSW